MPKTVSALELTLSDLPSHQTLSDWLYAELRGSILEGRLRPGTRLPASRDFARQHSLSRGTVVVAFERLRAEGLPRRVGHVGEPSRGGGRPLIGSSITPGSTRRPA